MAHTQDIHDETAIHQAPDEQLWDIISQTSQWKIDRSQSLTKALCPPRSFILQKNIIVFNVHTIVRRKLALWRDESVWSGPIAGFRYSKDFQPDRSFSSSCQEWVDRGARIPFDFKIDALCILPGFFSFLKRCKSMRQPPTIILGGVEGHRRLIARLCVRLTQLFKMGIFYTDNTTLSINENVSIKNFVTFGIFTNNEQGGLCMELGHKRSRIHVADGLHGRITAYENPDATQTLRALLLTCLVDVLSLKSPIWHVLSGYVMVYSVSAFVEEMVEALGSSYLHLEKDTHQITSQALFECSSCGGKKGTLVGYQAVELPGVGVGTTLSIRSYQNISDDTENRANMKCDSCQSLTLSPYIFTGASRNNSEGIAITGHLTFHKL